MNTFKDFFTYITYDIEAIGVLVIVIGCATGAMHLLSRLETGAITEIYHEHRHYIGRSILLGLDYLIAGDVIRTVIVSHTVTDVAAPALMVLGRAFLSFTLTLEIEAKLPWSRKDKENPKIPRVATRDTLARIWAYA